ncbi:platelet binding protein GspB-like [Atheta coriaria]|uniref:platelet binding protein GspB-like n=1 Tax=Dalotia coriaria TaxID=877792 RepID=UPI0031F41F81
MQSTINGKTISLEMKTIISESSRSTLYDVSLSKSKTRTIVDEDTTNIVEVASLTISKHETDALGSDAASADKDRLALFGVDKTEALEVQKKTDSSETTSSESKISFTSIKQPSTHVSYSPDIVSQVFVDQLCPTIETDTELSTDEHSVKAKPERIIDSDDEKDSVKLENIAEYTSTMKTLDLTKVTTTASSLIDQQKETVSTIYEGTSEKADSPVDSLDGSDKSMHGSEEDSLAPKGDDVSASPTTDSLEKSTIDFSHIAEQSKVSIGKMETHEEESTQSSKIVATHIVSSVQKRSIDHVEDATKTTTTTTATKDKKQEPTAPVKIDDDKSVQDLNEGSSGTFSTTETIDTSESSIKSQLEPHLQEVADVVSVIAGADEKLTLVKVGAPESKQSITTEHTEHQSTAKQTSTSTQSHSKTITKSITTSATTTTSSTLHDSEVCSTGMHSDSSATVSVDVQANNVNTLEVVTLRRTSKANVDDSMKHSDSAKFSETDVEPLSSETDSSFKHDLQLKGERASSKLKSEASQYDTDSPRSDDTEYTESHIESIIERDYSRRQDLIEHKDLTQFDNIASGDIIMDDDIIQITVHTPEIPAEKPEKIDDRKATSKLRKHTYIRKVSEKRDVSKQTRTFSPRLRIVKVSTETDVSSDEEKQKDKQQSKDKSHVRKATSGSSSVTSSPCKIPKLKRESQTKKTSTVITDVAQQKKYESKSKPFQIVHQPYKPPKVTRMYGYMQSTLSRDMKIEKKESESKRIITQPKTKSKKEQDNANRKTKDSKSAEGKRAIHAYERTTISSENKSREGTPVKQRTIKDNRDSPQYLSRTISYSSDSSTRSVLKEVTLTSNITKSDKKSVKINEIDIEKSEGIKYGKAEIPPRIHSPKPSPSPTKLRRTMPMEEHLKKVSISEKSIFAPSYKPSTDSERTVQFSDRNRSQSVTTYRAKTPEGPLLDRGRSPSSLPGSPIRARSANGSTQVITSEVFTSHDQTGSIEVIYRQPYENLKRHRTEGEMSMIDTTDSSLSESIALPSSPSDHEISSDANGHRQKSSSPPSPKSSRKSLESIQETYRVSDLITCAQMSGEQVLTFEEIQDRFQISEDESVKLPRQLLMSQIEKQYEATSSSYERTTSTSAIKSQEPPKDQEAIKTEEEEKSSGITRSVLPETADPTHSMAYPVPDEV